MGTSVDACSWLGVRMVNGTMAGPSSQLDALAKDEGIRIADLRNNTPFFEHGIE
jgi:hypothetical protein